MNDILLYQIPSRLGVFVHTMRMCFVEHVQWVADDFKPKKRRIEANEPDGLVKYLWHEGHIPNDGTRRLATLQAYIQSYSGD